MATRERQKQRTRQAIVDACAELLATGTSPSIDEVAAHSGVSRATIYRYFNSTADIVWQVMADREIETPAAVVADAGDDPVVRVLAAERAVNDYIFGDPAGVRSFEVTAIQRVLDGISESVDRPGRRLRYIDAALEPLAERLDAAAHRRLRHGLAMAIGSEALVSTLDACQLNTDEAREVTSWVCRALVQQAMAEAGLDSGTRG